MTAKEPLTRCIPLLALLVLTSACQEMSAPAAGDAVVGTPELPAEAPRGGEGIGDSPGKPSAPIGIRYEILGEPQVGRPLQIVITSQSRLTLGGVGIEVQGDERFYVPPASANVRVTRMAADDPVIRTLTVTPLVEGLLYLNVLVQGEIDGLLQANSVTIPIRVGRVEATTEPVGTLTTDEAGEAIISLPAQER